MEEREFWKTIPRKLFALLEVHNNLNTANPEDAEQAELPSKTIRKLTLEEALAWAGKS
jgi:hypothetical protein